MHFPVISVKHKVVIIFSFCICCMFSFMIGTYRTLSIRMVTMTSYMDNDSVSISTDLHDSHVLRTIQDNALLQIQDNALLYIKDNALLQTVSSFPKSGKIKSSIIPVI